MTQVTTERLVALCEEAWRATPGADGILLSCGGLRTLEAVQRVEDALGVPVVNGVAVGLKTAEMFVSLGMRHSARDYPATDPSIWA